MAIFSKYRKRNSPKIDQDFQFTEITLPGNDLVSAIKILSGPYTGVVYYYGAVTPKVTDGSAGLSFQYTIWDSGGIVVATLTNNKDFINYLGDILTAIILDDQEKGDYVSAGEFNSQESHL